MIPFIKTRNCNPEKTNVCFIFQDAYKSVGYIVSKLSDGKVQIIVTDADGVQSNLAGNDMVNDLISGT